MRIKYITPTYLLGSLLLLGGCADDSFLWEETSGTSDSITFEAYALRGNGDMNVRSGDRPIYDPLLLTSGEGGETLYLHTYQTDLIGYDPGEEEAATTRANQIASAADLKRYHASYKVIANLSNSENYFGWTDVQNQDSDINVWHTDRVQYWPGEAMLDFYAVSPAAAFSSLNDLSLSSGEMAFRYATHSSGNGKDAEMQPDLLLSSSSCNKKSSDNGKAPLKFSHALAAVKFAVRDVANGEIESITISGIKGDGMCRYLPASYMREATVEWTDLSGDASYTQNFNYTITGLGAVDANDESADILLNSKMPEKTFMLIPQLLDENARISVKVKRTGMTPERITVSGRIRDNMVEEWKAGHEYVYTISTSKSNWINVLEAYGNYNTATGKYGVTKGDQIYVYSPSYAILDASGRVQSYPHDTYGDNANFYVRSFRYHANDPSKKEILKWDASHEGGQQYRVVNGKETYVPGYDLTPAEWIPTRDALSGSGSYAAEGETKTLTFAAHHQITDWTGDIWMQAQDAYSDNSKSKPWDLSTCGGRLSRNTANSYVIDREGWYCFPLVYGNAIKNGDTNSKAYRYQGTGDASHINLVDYSGTAISSPKIAEKSTHTASVVWTDVYNAVSDVQLKTINGEKMILFKANKHNLQQGSVVIALYDGSNAVWSWHIWISEHWLDHSTGQPNAFKSDGKFSSFEKSASGWRQRGDILVNNKYVSSSYGYYIAPYNLGWCDPKDVDYLRRHSDMVFTQYAPDGTPTGLSAKVKVLQDGERVSYKVGNNTYYQWGRKDPIVGFVDHTQTVKRNFGPKKYTLTKSASGVNISTAIKNPHVMYYQNEDWCKVNYFNLWNNSTDVNKGIKTVYDPCPPGYMVPPAKLFEFVGPDNAGSFSNIESTNASLKNLSGVQVDDYTYKINAKTSAQTDKNSVWLTSTGNRWWKDGQTINGTLFNGGDNFNVQIVYLWATTKSPNKSYEALGLALGYDINNDNSRKYVICANFIGRRTMARPVRPIREF